MFTWKKLIMGAVAGAFCLGLSYAAPVYATTDNNTVVQVSDKIEYVKISPEEAAFRDKRNGNSMYVVEDRQQGLYKITCMEDVYMDIFKLDETWQGFKGSRDTIANVGYVNNCMHDLESGYMDEVAYHSYYQVKDIADGVGALPNHFETHYIYNDIDEKMFLAATCKVNNAPSTEFNIFGGYKFINATEVRMRQAPNLNGDIMGYFNQNERVYVYGYANIDYSAPLPNGWAFVKRENGQAGYVAAQFLQRAPIRGM